MPVGITHAQPDSFNIYLTTDPERGRAVMGIVQAAPGEHWLRVVTDPAEISIWFDTSDGVIAIDEGIDYRRNGWQKSRVITVAAAGHPSDIALEILTAIVETGIAIRRHP